LAAVLALASPAGAQQVTMLSPLASEYVIGGFRFTPPGGDGWRQLGQSKDVFRLVYADQLPDDKIDMRADVVAQAFEIPDPAQASSALALARLSQSQQIKERGDALVAFSKIEKVADDPEVDLFTLVSKSGTVDAFETYAVTLAPDKSSYLVARLTTREKDFRDAPYYKGFLEALGKLQFEAAPGKPADTAEPAREEDAPKPES